MRRVFAETPRVEALELVPEDFDLYRGLLQDPDVMAHLGGPFTDEMVEQRFQRSLDHWKDHGFGTGVVRLKASKEHIGIASLFWTSIEGERVLEVGVAISPEFQSAGLARELADLLVDFIHQHVKGAKAVTAFPDPANARSIALLKKLGFRRVKAIDYDYVGRTLQSEYWRFDLE